MFFIHFHFRNYAIEEKFRIALKFFQNNVPALKMRYVVKLLHEGKVDELSGSKIIDFGRYRQERRNVSQ